MPFLQSASLRDVLKSEAHAYPQLRLPQDYLYQPLFFQTNAASTTATRQEAIAHSSPVTYLDRALNFSAVTASEDDDKPRRSLGHGADHNTPPLPSSDGTILIGTRATMLRQEHTMAKARAREAQAARAAQPVLADFVTPEDDVNARMLRPTRAMRLREAFVGRQKAAANSAAKNIFHSPLPTNPRSVPLRSPRPARARATTPSLRDTDDRTATPSSRQTRAVQLRGVATERRLRAMTAAERRRAAEAARPHTPAITSLPTATNTTSAVTPHGIATGASEPGTTRTWTLRRQYVQEQQAVLAQAAAAEVAIRQALLQPTAHVTTPRRPRPTRSAQMRELHGATLRWRRESEEAAEQKQQKVWSGAGAPRVQSARQTRSRAQSISRATSLPSPRQRRRGASGSPEYRTPQETGQQSENHAPSRRPPSLRPDALAAGHAERSPSVRFARHDADTEYLALRTVAGAGASGVTVQCATVAPHTATATAATAAVQSPPHAASPVAPAVAAVMLAGEHDTALAPGHTRPMASDAVATERADGEQGSKQAAAEVAVQEQPCATQLRSPMTLSPMTNAKAGTAASRDGSARHDEAMEEARSHQQRQPSFRTAGHAEDRVLLSPTAVSCEAEGGAGGTRRGSRGDADTAADGGKHSLRRRGGDEAKASILGAPAADSRLASVSPRALSLHRAPVTANWHYRKADANATLTKGKKEEMGEENEELMASEAHATTLLGQYKRLRHAVVRWRCGFYYHAWVHAVQTQRARDCKMAAEAVRPHTNMTIDATQHPCLSPPLRSPSLRGRRLLSPHNDDMLPAPTAVAGAQDNNAAVATAAPRTVSVTTARSPDAAAARTTASSLTAKAASDLVDALLSGTETCPPPLRLRLRSPSSQPLAAATPQSSRSASLSLLLADTQHRGATNTSKAKPTTAVRPDTTSPPMVGVGRGLVGFAPLSQDPLACTVLPLLQEHPPSLDTSRLQLPRSSSNTTSNTNGGTTPPLCACPAQPLPSPRPRRAVTTTSHGNTPPATLPLSPTTADAALPPCPVGASTTRAVVTVAVVQDTAKEGEEGGATNSSINNRTVAAEVTCAPEPGSAQTEDDKDAAAAKGGVTTKIVRTAAASQVEGAEAASQRSCSARSPSSSSVTRVAAGTAVTAEGSTIVPSTTADSLRGFSHTSATTVPSEGLISALLPPRAEADTPHPARPARTPPLSPPPPPPRGEEMTASPPLPPRGMAAWTSADLSPCSYSSSSCLPSPSRGASMAAETMAAPPQAAVLGHGVLATASPGTAAAPQVYFTSLSSTSLTTPPQPLQREQTAQERSPRDPPSLRGPPSSAASSVNEESDGEEQQRQLRRHAPTPNRQHCLAPPPPPTSTSSSSSTTSSSSFMGIAAGVVMTAEAAARPATQPRPAQSPPGASEAPGEDMQPSNPCTPRRATLTRSPGHTATTGTTVSTDDTSPEDFVILGRDDVAGAAGALRSAAPACAMVAAAEASWHDLPAAGTEPEAGAPLMATAVVTGTHAAEVLPATALNASRATERAAQEAQGTKTRATMAEQHTDAATGRTASGIATNQQQPAVASRAVLAPPPPSQQQVEQLVSPGAARPASPYSPHTTDLAASTRTENCLWSEPELPLQPRLHTLSSHGSLDEVHDRVDEAMDSEVVTLPIRTSDGCARQEGAHEIERQRWPNFCLPAFSLLSTGCRLGVVAMNRIAVPSPQDTQRQPFYLPLASSNSLSTTLDDTAADDASLDDSSSFGSGLERSARVEAHDDAARAARVLDLVRVTGSASTHVTLHCTPQTSGLVASAESPWFTPHAATYVDDVEELSDAQLQTCNTDVDAGTLFAAVSTQATCARHPSPSCAALLQQAIALQQARCGGAYAAAPVHPYAITLVHPSSLPHSSSLRTSGGGPTAAATAVSDAAAQCERASATLGGDGVPRNAQLVCRLRRELCSVSAEQLRRYHMLRYSVRQRLYRCYFDLWQRVLSRAGTAVHNAGTQTLLHRARVQERRCNGDDDDDDSSAVDIARRFGADNARDTAAPLLPSRRFQWSVQPDVVEDGIAATSRPYRLLDYAARSDAVPRKARSASCSPTPALALPAVVPHPVRIIRV